MPRSRSNTQTYHLGHERSRYFRLDWTDNRLATTGRGQGSSVAGTATKVFRAGCMFLPWCTWHACGNNNRYIGIPCRGGSQEALSVSSVELAEEQSSYVQVG